MTTLQTTKPWAEPTVGIITLGTGTASESTVESIGSLNVSGFPTRTSPNGSTSDALAYAFTRAKHVHLLPGLYPAFEETVSVPDGCVLTGDPGAILQPATSGAVGMFSGAGQATLSGFQVRVTTWVASMSIWKWTSGKDVRIDDVLWTVDTHTPGGNATLALAGLISNGTPGTPVGSNSTPMKLIDLVTTLRPRVRGCVFLPAYAVTCISIDEGNGFTIADNNFTNDLAAGIGGVQVAIPRLCYRGVEIVNGEWGAVYNNRFWALGDAEAGGFAFFSGGPNLLDSAVYWNQTVAHSTDEHGHSQIYLNRIEVCGTAGAVRIYGGNSITVASNLIGYLNDGPDALGEAGLVIAGANGNDDTLLSKFVLVQGNDFHNCGKAATNGAMVYVKQAWHLSFFGNSCKAQSSTYALIIDTPTVGAVTVQANAFAASMPTAGASTPPTQTIANAIRLVAGTISATIYAIEGSLQSGIGIGSNSLSGYSTGLVSDASNASASKRRKILRGVQDTSTGNDVTTGGDLANATTNLRLDA